MTDKEIAERFAEAYLSDESKHQVRRWKKEFYDASNAGREELRRKFPNRQSIYDDIENES